MTNATTQNNNEASYWQWQEKIVEYAEHNVEFLQRKLEVFCSELIQLYSTLEEAVIAADYTIVCLSANALKKSCKQLAAEEAYNIAAELEKMGEHQDLWCAHSMMCNLKKELQQLLLKMQHLQNESVLVH